MAIRNYDRRVERGHPEGIRRPMRRTKTGIEASMLGVCEEYAETPTCDKARLDADAQDAAGVNTGAAVRRRGCLSGYSSGGIRRGGKEHVRRLPREQSG
jgi:hypothetical protein